ncbi:DUF2977 domain-containing protein [Staphylococcus xylosus]|uniref:DUF2977 domain-containing protein n=1 Tax=Staphylococcus xylosus TaxID=1288 RepID=UPI003364F6EC
MKIQINSSSEIVAYVVVGDLNNGIEINDAPTGFVEDFKPKKYRYTNGQIVLNESYENNVDVPIDKPIPNITGNDEELRKMFASMQVQLVQANTMVLQLSQQNAQLSQEVVRINQEIENLKGAIDYGDVVSEV